MYTEAYVPNYTDLLSGDPGTVQYFETGEGYDELDAHGQALVDYVAENAVRGAIPEVSDVWMLGQKQHEFTRSVLVPVVSEIPEDSPLDFLKWDPTGGNR